MIVNDACPVCLALDYYARRAGMTDGGREVWDGEIFTLWWREGRRCPAHCAHLITWTPDGPVAVPPGPTPDPAWDQHIRRADRAVRGSFGIPPACLPGASGWVDAPSLGGDHREAVLAAVSRLAQPATREADERVVRVPAPSWAGWVRRWLDSGDPAHLDAALGCDLPEPAEQARVIWDIGPVAIYIPPGRRAARAPVPAGGVPVWVVARGVVAFLAGVAAVLGVVTVMLVLVGR